MAIALPKDVREEAISSIQMYALEYMEERIGSITAGALLDFFLEEIGPCIYNKAVADVQERLQARIMEVYIEVHEAEFPYWQRHAQKMKNN